MIRRPHEHLRELVQRFVRGFGLLEEATTPCGKAVSPSEAHALQALLDRQRAGLLTTQRELRDVLGIDKSNVTRLVQRLDDAGRVTQAVCADDARARELRLTPRGMRLAEEVEGASQGHFARLLLAVPRAQRERTLEGLAALAAAVETMSVQQRGAGHEVDRAVHPAARVSGARRTAIRRPDRRR